MDAVPIVPPLFWGTKNTTLHELQTGDRSRATDTTKSAHCRGLPTGVSLSQNRNRPHREATARAPPGVRIAHCNGGTAMPVAPTLQKYLDQTVTYEMISHDPTMSS